MAGDSKLNSKRSGNKVRVPATSNRGGMLGKARRSIGSRRSRNEAALAAANKALRPKSK